MWTDTRLSDDEVLAHRSLTLVGGRGVPVAGDAPGGVRCGRPLLYPVTAGDLPRPLSERATGSGHRYAGALFAFDLDPLGPGRRYTGARFEVTLTDAGSRALRLETGGDAMGLVQDADATRAASPLAARAVAAARTRPGWLRRLAGQRYAPRAWPSGVQTATFGWNYDDPRGRLLLPDTYGVHALLEVPPGSAQVSGVISVQVEVSGPDGPRRATISESVTFSERLAGPDQEQRAAVRLCMAADVVGYSRRRNAETAQLQRDLVALMARVRAACGIRESEVEPQPQGDGQFTVLPVGIDESAVIPALVRELGAGLADRNRGLPEEQRMRLRVALHRGLVSRDANGWVGTSAIAVHRLLDSSPLRAAVRDHAAAGYVLGVPDVLYRDVIVHAVEPPRPGDFAPITVDLPAKDFVEQGWLHVGPDLG